MNEQEFGALVYAKFKAHFDHYYSLLALAEKSLKGHSHFTKNEYDSALQYIVARAFKSFDSIRRLCLLGDCEDAGVILRCLLNLMAVTRWISRKPERRSKLYLDWFWVEASDLIDREPQRLSATQKAYFQERFDAVKSQFEVRNRKGKVEFAKHWYQPEVNSIFEMFEEVGLKEHYDGAYRPLSGVEHSDVMTYFGMFATARESNGETRLDVHNDLYVRDYLRNGFQYFGDIFELCNQTLLYAESTQVQTVIETGKAFYKADMQSRGVS